MQTCRVVRPRAVIADIQGGARTELLLNLGDEIPQVVSNTESPQNVVVVAGRARIVLPEIAIGNRPALAIFVEVTQIAIRDEILIDVGPRARDRIHGCHDGIVRGRDVCVHLADVTPDRRLQRCAPGAEQIV